MIVMEMEEEKRKEGKKKREMNTRESRRESRNETRNQATEVTMSTGRDGKGETRKKRQQEE